MNSAWSEADKYKFVLYQTKTR